MTVRFPDPPHAGRTVLEVERPGQVATAARTVFEDVDFDVGRGERLLVMGLNGAGKTSLLRILAGVTDADARRRSASAINVVARLLRAGARGHRAPAATLLDHMRESVDRDSPTTSCAACSACSASPATRCSRTRGTLSGGEKTKLALAQLVAGRHNLLLLDEPTNNLDPGSRERGGRRARRRGPARSCSSATTPSSSSALAPDRVLLMPDGDFRNWSPDMADLVAMA